MKKCFLVIVLISVVFLTTGCKKHVVGKWKSIESEYEYYYIFNKDKTCSYEMVGAKLECTYVEDDNKLTILYKGTTREYIFDYRFEDGNLIITDNTGNDNKFVKEK